MDEQRRTALLTELTGLLDQLVQRPEPPGRTTTIRQFMDRLFDLYVLTLGQNAGQNGGEISRFVASTAPQVAKILPSIDLLFIPEIDELIHSTWYGDEWREVCRRRSALESFKELYGDHLSPSALTSLETTELDEMIRDRGSREGPVSPAARIRGLPPTHWWWWWPHRPPV